MVAFIYIINKMKSFVGVEQWILAYSRQSCMLNCLQMDADRLQMDTSFCRNDLMVEALDSLGGLKV